MKRFLKKLAFIFFPPKTRRGKWLKKMAIKMDLVEPYTIDPSYQYWVEKTEAFNFIDPIEPAGKQSKLPYLSIVIPTFNTKDKYLDPLLYSIINQSYTRWELILADASTDKERAAAIAKAAKQDSRIKYIKLSNNGGISANTDAGLKYASNNYVIFMDHDDTLSLHALNEVAACIIDNPQVEIIYSDEDKLDDSGTIRHAPHFKPDWSPHQYLSCNWTSHLSVVKNDLVKRVGGFNPKYDGAQDYDFILRLLALPGDREILHIPKVLYHWRVAEGSTAGNIDEKSYAMIAGCSALNDYLKAKGINAKAETIKDRPAFYKVVFNPSPKHRALIIVNSSIDGRQNQALLNRLKASSSSQTATTFVTLDEFNSSKQTFLDKLTPSDSIFSINGVYEITHTKWVDQLCGVLTLDDVRAVSPRIMSVSGYIKDMGIIVDSGVERNLFEHLPGNAGSIFGHTEWIRDVARVSGCFYGAKKEVWLNLQKGIKRLPNNGAAKSFFDVVWPHVTVTFISNSDLTGYWL